MIDNDKDADSLEYLITVNSCIPPSEHLLSVHSSVLWISRMNELNEICCCVESIVIQGGVGLKEKTFNLSNLSCLRSVSMGYNAFRDCHWIVFESTNDCMNDE